jgi:hypothetical protein
VEVSQPRDLATNIAGRLFVAESGKGLVRRLSTSGNITIRAGKTNSADTAPDTSSDPHGRSSNMTDTKTPRAVAVTDLRVWWAPWDSNPQPTD